MGNKIKVTFYKNINNVDIKDQNPLFEKIKDSISHIGNTNYSLIIHKKTEGFFCFILNKLKLALNIKISIKSCKNKVNECFYTQLNANTSLCKIKDINDITLDEFRVMNLFFNLDNNEMINLFVKRHVKTKADLILIDTIFNCYKNKDFGKVNLRDFVGEKFNIGKIVNLFNTIILDVNNVINNNVFLFIINCCFKKKSECISRVLKDIIIPIRYYEYLFEIDKSILNIEKMTKVTKNINIEKIVSEIEKNLKIEKVLIDEFVSDALQKYNNADNYVKTQEAWINKLYNKKENNTIIYNINKNRMLITQEVEEIANSLDDDALIIGMPKDQYLIRMEQIVDIFATLPIM